MTITAYHLDSVLNAYTRQSKVKVSAPVHSSEAKTEGTLKDVVSLSSSEESHRQEMERISYTLRDFLLKDQS